RRRERQGFRSFAVKGVSETRAAGLDKHGEFLVPRFGQESIDHSRSPPREPPGLAAGIRQTEYSQAPHKDSIRPAFWAISPTCVLRTMTSRGFVDVRSSSSKARPSIIGPIETAPIGNGVLGAGGPLCWPGDRVRCLLSTHFEAM